jgi:hypothetical protein
MILALDISTTTIGVALINNGKVSSINYISLKKTKDLIDKIQETSDWFDNDPTFQKVKYKIKEVRIEQFLQSFRKGMSSAATITKLAGFNTAVQYLMYVKLSLRPNMIASNVARKSIGIKLDKQKDTKEQICEFVHQHYYPLPRKILKGGPRKGQETWADHANDIADAIVIGLS